VNGQVNNTTGSGEEMDGKMNVSYCTSTGGRMEGCSKKGPRPSRGVAAEGQKGKQVGERMRWKKSGE